MSVREVSLRASAKFHCERARAYLRLRCKRAPEGSNMLKHALSETLLSQHSFAHSETLLSQRTLAAKLRVHSQRSLESIRSFDRPRSFAATIVEASTHSNVEASTHSSGSKLHSQFYFFRRNRSTVLASLTACRRVADETRGHCREFGVKPCSNGTNFSIR